MRDAVAPKSPTYEGMRLWEDVLDTNYNNVRLNPPVTYHFNCSEREKHENKGNCVVMGQIYLDCKLFGTPLYC